MKVLSKVTLCNMKQNRTRTLVTIVGVIISAAMFTAILTLCASLMDFLQRSYIYKSGDFHFSVQTEGAEAEKLKADPRTVHAGSLAYLGYAQIESQNEYKPYLYVAAADETFIDTMPIHLTQGALPADSSEVLIPAHLSQNGGVVYRVGDQIELTLGDRAYRDGIYLQDQAYPTDDPAEVFTKRRSVSYTVSGIYERPDFENYSAPGYTLLTRQQSGAGLSEKGIYDLYVKVKNPQKNLETMVAAYGFEKVDYNHNLLMFSGWSRYANFGSFIYGLAAIFIFLILLGSVSMIYSAFSISTGERTRQFGLLASVGATKKQIRSMVRFEALTVSAAGIPLGLLTGVLGMGITLHFIGDKFSGIMSAPFPVALHVSPSVLLAGALISFATVMISVFIPAKRASSVSAIEAIRQNQDVAQKGRPVKSAKLSYKLFGLEGLLARKYFKRARRKYRTTIVSLAMSVILFISSSVFCMYLTESVQVGLYTSGYDVMYRGVVGPEHGEPLVSQFAELEGVKSVSCTNYTSRDILLSPEDIDRSYAEYLSVREGYGYDYWPNMSIYYLDLCSYERLLEENGLDKARYLEAENPPAIVLNHSQVTEEYYSDGKIDRISYDVTFLKKDIQTLEAVLPQEEREGYYCAVEREQIDGQQRVVYYYIKTGESPVYDENNKIQNGIRVPAEYEPISLGAQIESAPLGVLSGSNIISLIYPYNDTILSDLYSTGIYFLTDDYETMMTGIKDVLADQSLPCDDNYFDDKIAQDQENQDLITLINVLAYGFIILISLIAAANVFNTVSTNIALRGRDFAMLRSVGMTGRGLNRMMNYECLLYGSRALLFGLPLSVLISHLIYRVVRQGVMLAFKIPPAAVIIAVCSVFVVVFVTMLYAMRKIKRENLMDALKNENI